MPKPLTNEQVTEMIQQDLERGNPVWVLPRPVSDGGEDRP